MATDAEVTKLADAMWQILDDMGEKGLSACGAAKAYARVAFEPFRDKSEGEYHDWMSLAQAQAIVDDIERQQ